MIQNYTYHCHTNFSDGKNSIEEMVAQAKKIGFSHIGITDHLIVHKNIEQSPSWPMMFNKPDSHIYKKDFAAALPLYQRHCEKLRQVSKRENFKIFIGFEVDYFTYSGWLEELQNFLSYIDYDYLISGNHFLFNESCEKIYNIHKNIIDFCNEEELNDLILSHFKVINESAKSRLFKFIAHLDYVRKIGTQYYNSQKFNEEKTELIKGLKNSGVGAEISTKGLRKIGDFYPDEWFLKKLKEFEIPVVISDDAHSVDELGFDFNKAEENLKKLNISKRIGFL